MSLQIDNPCDYHVALYIRLSKEDENAGPSQSVQNQESLLREFVQKQKLCIYDLYVDDGFSGTNFDRPNFLRMISDIEMGNVNMVITKDLSRLGRDYILTGYYLERYFPEHRVRYLSLLDGIDTGVESTANDITPFRAIINDMYAKDISKKIKSVKRNQQRMGEFIGGKPVYGYKMHPTEKHKIVIDEEAASVVRRVFALAVSGMSCRKIAELLNKDGVPTPAAYANLPVPKQGPYSGLWSSERISEMLKNESYIGNMVQGRSMRISYKSKKCIRQAPENWVVVKGTHEPVVDLDTFQKVQVLLVSRRHTRNRTYDFLLKGLIFCHECGYPLAVLNRKNAAGEDRLFFVCRTYQRFTKSGVCTCHSIKEETVNQAVLSKVYEVCQKYLCFDRFLPIAKEIMKKTAAKDCTETEIQALKRKVAGLTADLDQIYIDRLKGILLEQDFQRLYAKVKMERDGLENQIKKLCETTKQEVYADEKAEAFVVQFLDSILMRRELLVSLIERIELTENKELIIKFRFCKPDMTSKDCN